MTKECQVLNHLKTNLNEILDRNWVRDSFSRFVNHIQNVSLFVEIHMQLEKNDEKKIIRVFVFG